MTRRTLLAVLGAAVVLRRWPAAPPATGPFAGFTGEVPPLTWTINRKITEASGKALIAELHHQTAWLEHIHRSLRGA